ncbi:MAG: hypothetical protein SNJ75_16315 [Gemmataceae bacterium]
MSRSRGVYKFKSIGGRSGCLRPGDARAAVGYEHLGRFADRADPPGVRNEGSDPASAAAAQRRASRAAADALA